MRKSPRSVSDVRGTSAEARNLARLRLELVGAAGDAREAVRRYTGKSTRAMAKALGLDRVSVQLCLGKTYGRRYNATRRALELGLRLPPYSLDELLDTPTEATVDG